MTFLENAKAELKDTPLSTIASLVGVLVSVIGIVVPLVLPTGSPPGRPAAAGIDATETTNLSIISQTLLAIGGFLSLTVLGSQLAKFIYSKNKFIGLPISVIIAAVACFLSRILAYSAGVTAQSPKRVAAIDSLIVYGTILMFFALAGYQPIRDFIRCSRPEIQNSEISTEDALGIFGVIVIFTIIWSVLVNSSYTRLVAAFL